MEKRRLEKLEPVKQYLDMNQKGYRAIFDDLMKYAIEQEVNCTCLLL